MDTGGERKKLIHGADIVESVTTTLKPNLTKRNHRVAPSPPPTPPTLSPLYRLPLQLHFGVPIANDDGLWVLLNAAHGPHVVDALLDAHVQSHGLVETSNQDHYLREEGC